MTKIASEAIDDFFSKVCAGQIGTIKLYDGMISGAVAGEQDINISLLKDETIEDADYQQQIIDRLSTAIGQAQAKISLIIYLKKINNVLATKLHDLVEHTSITELIFGQCEFEDAAVQTTFSGITANTSLKKLGIYPSKPYNDEDMRAIARAIQSNGNIEDLAFCYLGDDGVGILAEELTGNEQASRYGAFTNIDFSHANFTDEGARNVAKIVDQNTKLVVLNVGNSKIGKDGFVALGEVIGRHPSLSSFDASFNKAGPEGGAAIAKAVSLSRTLRLVRLGANELGDLGAQYFGTILESNPVLEELNVGCNQIGPTGSRFLGDAIRKNDRLKIADFSNNNLGDEGAEILAQALLYNGGIRSLEVDSNNIGPTGAKALGLGLAKNNVMAGFRANNNNFGDEGAKYFFEGVAPNRTLLEIALKANKISAAGIHYAAAAIQQGLSIESYILNDNPIGDDGFISIGEAVAKNTKVKRLYLDNCGAGDRGGRSLAQSAEASHLQCISIGGNRHRDLTAEAFIRTIKVSTSLVSLVMQKEPNWYAVSLQRRVEGNLTEQEQYAAEGHLISESYVRGLSEAAAATTNKNLIQVRPFKGIGAGENYNIARQWMKRIQSSTGTISILDLPDIQERMPAIVYQFVAGYYCWKDRLHTARTLVSFQNKVRSLGVNVQLPEGFDNEFLSRQKFMNYRHPTQDPDLSYLNQVGVGTHQQRLQRAVHDVTGQLHFFDETIEAIEATLIKALEQEKVLSQRVDVLHQQVHEAENHNRAIDRRIIIEERSQKASQSRWVSESIIRAIVGAGAFLLTGGLSEGLSLATVFGSRGKQGLFFQMSLDRSAGYGMVARNESQYKNDIIEMLRAEKIDVASYYREIQVVSAKLVELAELKPVMRMQADRQNISRLYKAHLRRQILAQGLENSKNLATFAQRQNITLDEFFKSFDGRVGQALLNFGYGYADSDDLHIIIAYSDTLSSDKLQPHECVLKRAVESFIKPSIVDIIPKSSRVDILKSIMPSFTGASSDPTSLAIEFGSPAFQAMSMLVRSNFSTVGSPAIDAELAFVLHRHGDEFLRSTQVNDGLVDDEIQPKNVAVMSEPEQREFVERVRQYYRSGMRQLPPVKYLFIRICAAEYFLPQKVRTSGEQGIFSQYPQAPVAYPMVNEVVRQFLGRMNFHSIDDYNNFNGDRLKNLIAQTFIDFFAVLGNRHNSKFAEERCGLATAHDVGTYGTRFTMAVQAITDDALEHFGLFQELFYTDLQRTLEIKSEKDNAKLLQQLAEFRQVSRSLVTDSSRIIMPGTPEALNLALKGQSRRFSNMRLPMLEAA